MDGAAILVAASVLIAAAVASRTVPAGMRLAALFGGLVFLNRLGSLVLLAIGLVASAIRRAQRMRGTEKEETQDLIRLADLLTLGLSAGLTTAAALREAAGELTDRLRDDVELLVRRSTTTGMAAALATWEGRGRRLFGLMARAFMTGAPMIGAVEAFATELRHAEHTRVLATVRRLPVRLLIPLALLILPGFVVLVVGPALARSLARLDVVP